MNRKTEHIDINKKHEEVKHMKTWMKKLTALILIALLVIGSVNLTVDLNGESGEGLSFSITEASAKGKKVAPKKVTIDGSKYVA